LLIERAWLQDRKEREIFLAPGGVERRLIDRIDQDLAADPVEKPELPRHPFRIDGAGGHDVEHRVARSHSPPQTLGGLPRNVSTIEDLVVVPDAINLQVCRNQIRTYLIRLLRIGGRVG